MGELVGDELAEDSPATTRARVSPLQEAVESFGRRGRRLTAARLEAVPDILIALRGPRVLADLDARRKLAAEIEQTLRATIIDMKDPTDRRIAQVVLASEPEFYDDTIERRKQTVLAGDMAFSANQFAVRRPRIVTELVVALRSELGGVELSVEGSMPGDTYAFVTQLARSTRALGVMVYAYDVAALCAHRAGGRRKLHEALVKHISSRNRISDSAMFEFAWSQHLLRKAALDSTLTRWMLDQGLHGYLGGYLDSEYGPDAHLGRLLVSTHGFLEPGPFVDLWLERESELFAKRAAGKNDEWREDFANGFLLMMTDNMPARDLIMGRVWEPSEEGFPERHGYGRRVLLEAIGYLWSVLQPHIPYDPLEVRDIGTMTQWMTDFLVCLPDEKAWDEPEREGFERPVLNQEARQFFTEQFFGEPAVRIGSLTPGDPDIDSLL